VAEAAFAVNGQRIFIAKGCITCHAHEQVDRDIDGTIFVDTGPDLSDYSADPGFLSSWLADPAAIKPETEMPDLELDQAEIEALVDFLNSD
jgi:cytochrome c oxidase subunit 2